MIKIKRMITIFRNHGHHLIFILSLLSLGSLVVWWSVFIHTSIEQRQQSRLDLLNAEIKLYALQLGHDGEKPPVKELLNKDNRFEIVDWSPPGNRFFVRLETAWPGLGIKVKDSVFLEIKKQARLSNFMLVGESGVLILVVLVSSIFLYRFIRLEKRTSVEVSEFWERTAHEIKTPITGLKAFLQNLKSGDFEKENLSSYIDLALGQVERQEKLAGNVLSGFGLTAEKASLRFSEFDLTAFIQDYINNGAVQISAFSVIPLFDPTRAIPVIADPNALKVILDNIFDNAVKYIPGEPKLKLNIRTEGNKAVVTIKDNGPGFQRKEQDRLFSAFKHLRGGLPVPSRGTGMGLYISKRLAERMSGTLEAVSRGHNMGAEFRIFLRRGKSHEE